MKYIVQAISLTVLLVALAACGADKGSNCPQDIPGVSTNAVRPEAELNVDEETEDGTKDAGEEE